MVLTNNILTVNLISTQQIFEGLYVTKWLIFRNLVTKLIHCTYVWLSDMM